MMIFVCAAVILLPGCKTSKHHGQDQASAADDDSGGTDDELLQQFEPVVIQRIAQDYSTLAYTPEDDLLGGLSLLPGDGNFDQIVGVDTTAPVVYMSTASATIRGNSFKQLIYAMYYPERAIPYTFEQDPAGWLLKWYDAGKIDGKVIRVTLGLDGRTPLLIEAMQSCGCGWQLFANKIVDDAARQEFEKAGQQYPGLEKSDAPNDVEYVHVLPADVSGAAAHPVLVDDYGWTTSSHNIMGAFTSFAQWQASGLAIDKGLLYLPQDLDVGIADPGALQETFFARQPYDPLYRLKPQGSDAEIGIFDSYGYIWNAYSSFYKNLRDTTSMTEFPGTPRAPAAFEVVHETMKFWEQETLFNTFIYLPASLFGQPASR